MQTYDLEDILTVPVYRSIINLTFYFQDKDYPLAGLERRHYRWVLIAGHDNINDPYYVKKMTAFFSSRYTPEAWKTIRKEQKNREQQTQRYFKEKEGMDLKAIEEDYPPEFKTSLQRIREKAAMNPGLDYFCKTGEITAGCIQGKSANNNLGNFLKKLCDTYHVLEKTIDTQGSPRYILPDYSKILMFQEAEEIRMYVNYWLGKEASKKVMDLWSAAISIEHPVDMKDLDALNEQFQKRKKR